VKVKKTMTKKLVKDLMVPLDEYPLVKKHDTLLDVIRALDEGQKRLPPGRQPYRAVLVADEHGKVVGKIGQLAFLTALEPKYSLLGDLGKLDTTGLSPELVNLLMEHHRFFEDSLPDLCRRGSAVRAEDTMHPLAESVDENASLSDAIHKIVMWQQLSLLVTRGDDAVGLIRLSDLYDEVARQMQSLGQ
jgi:CBS domain-containing protein